LKRKKGSFFQSITSLQKNGARVTSRKEQLEEKSTGARNDYILSLAAANAHQTHYFKVDLQTTMATMENYVYERVADYIALIGRTELLTCMATQNSFGKIRDQGEALTREYNLQCCYLYYPVLKQHIYYDFEPCDNDPVRKVLKYSYSTIQITLNFCFFQVTVEHESAIETLNREGKRLVELHVKMRPFVRMLENWQLVRLCAMLATEMIQTIRIWKQKLMSSAKLYGNLKSPRPSQSRVLNV
jgi:F-BAR and double SH3 domains protein